MNNPHKPFQDKEQPLLDQLCIRGKQYLVALLHSLPPCNHILADDENSIIAVAKS